MKKLQVILFMFLLFLFIPSKCFCQSGKGGIKFKLLMKPNSYLDSVSFLINDKEKVSFKIDTNGDIPSVLLEPGTYNIKVLTKDFQRIEILDMLVEPNILSFQKLILDRKLKLYPESSTVIKYVKPEGTHCR